jgi:hypothetical protein
MWIGVDPDDLDATFNLGTLELTVTTLQREAARLSSAYLSTFIASELGEPERPPALSVWDKAFGGGDLREALRSAVIKTKQAIGEGEDPTKATRKNRMVLVNDVGLFIDTAARESLRQGMEMDDRIVGYQRALKGTCGACAGNVAVETSVELPSIPLRIHPNCQCVTEPVVGMKGTPVVPQRGLAERAAPAFNALARHRWPRRDSIPIREVETPDEFVHKGIFPQEIRVKRGQSARELNTSIAHEGGHYLDMLMVDRKILENLGQKFLSGKPTPEMREVLRIARASETMKRIKRDYPADAKYLNRSDEIWARAYAQWQGFPETKAEWAWSAEEFRPIARAIEKVLRARGLS